MNSSPKRILIVSSERHIVRLIEVNMARQGYEIGKAFSGQEALALLEAEHFDIAVVDCNQVDMTRGELVERISATSDIRVILLDEHRQPRL
ncbi:MAG: response regulator [Fimbriimonadaceae bacterium]